MFSKWTSKWRVSTRKKGEEREAVMKMAEVLEEKGISGGVRDV
jgi:hypothetical protein